MRRIALGIIATSYGLGPFHPAFRSIWGGQVWYWSNVTMPTEDEARDFALKALQDAEDAAEAIASQWNVVEV